MNSKIICLILSVLPVVGISQASYAAGPQCSGVFSNSSSGVGYKNRYVLSKRVQIPIEIQYGPVEYIAKSDSLIYQAKVDKGIRYEEVQLLNLKTMKPRTLTSKETTQVFHSSVSANGRFFSAITLETNRESLFIFDTQTGKKSQVELSSNLTWFVGNHIIESLQTSPSGEQTFITFKDRVSTKLVHFLINSKTGQAKHLKSFEQIAQHNKMLSGNFRLVSDSEVLFIDQTKLYRFNLKNNRIETFATAESSLGSMDSMHVSRDLKNVIIGLGDRYTVGYDQFKMVSLTDASAPPQALNLPAKQDNAWLTDARTLPDGGFSILRWKGQVAEHLIYQSIDGQVPTQKTVITFKDYTNGVQPYGHKSMLVKNIAVDAENQRIIMMIKPDREERLGQSTNYLDIWSAQP